MLSFRAGVVVDGKDIMDDYKEESVDEKYRNREPKERVVDITGNPPVEEYVCEECGRSFEYSTEKMDAADPTDEPGMTDGSLTAYHDLQITKATIGKALCSDCLAEWIRKTKDITWEKKDTRS